MQYFFTNVISIFLLLIVSQITIKAQTGDEAYSNELFLLTGIVYDISSQLAINQTPVILKKAGSSEIDHFMMTQNGHF